MKSKGRVSIIGAGYVGLTTAILFASSNIETYLLDIDHKKIQTINDGRSPFFEPDLDKLLAKVISSNMLKPITDYKKAISLSECIFCCVGTPDRANGSSNLDYVFEALEKAASIARNGVILVQKSTVPVGTGRKVIASIHKKTPKLKFSYVSNPEFLREGSAISDSLYPDRTVLGGSDHKAMEKVASLYKNLEESALKIEPSPKKQNDTNSMEETFIYTTLESAELIKVTANAFLALKISFANSIAKLCDSVDADINEVMDGIGKDKRIGRAFLQAGRGYGGGCFPKDVSGLISSAAEHNVDMEIMRSAVHVNSSMANYIVERIENKYQTIKGARVAVLGLSFKAGTSDSRRSPAVAIANLLAEKGAEVYAYDPKAIIEGDQELHEFIQRKESMKQAIKNANILVIATDWPEFVQLDYKKAKLLMRGKLVVDCMNTIDKKIITEAELIYMGIGQ